MGKIEVTSLNDCVIIELSGDIKEEVMGRITSISITILYTIGLLVLISSCVPSSNPTRVSSPPTINLKIDPAEIVAGSPAMLIWNVVNANSVIIDQKIGKKDAGGLLMVMPEVDTTYTFTASNVAGKSTKSVSVKVLSKVMSLNISKPDMNLQTRQTNPNLARSNPKELLNPIKVVPLKTYKETIYDFVKLAPTAIWSTFEETGTLEIPIASFPSTSPELRIWNNMVMEDGVTYKEALYINIPMRWNVNGLTTNAINFYYPVTIPSNSWFTARIGMPKLPDPPPANQLVAEIRPSLWGVNWVSGCGLGVYSIYYDDSVEYVDVDISLQSGGNMIGTSGWFYINAWAPEGNRGAPIAFGDLRIVRP